MIERWRILSTIYVVTATDDRYAKHLAVMFYSLLENKSSTNPIVINVLYNEISEENKSILNETVKRFNTEIKFIKVDPSQYNGYMTWNNWNKKNGASMQYLLAKEIYYRISIPDLLDKDVNKVIYLDTDLIIKEDLITLWNINIENYFLAAVKDVYVRNSRHSDLSIPKDYDYFNNGVLVMNLRKWRENNITNQIIDFMQRNSRNIHYPSQDPMNAILYDKWLPLDAKWNYQSYHNRLKLKIKPAIIHYTGPKKPWKSNHPLREEYLNYAKKLQEIVPPS